MSDLLTYKTAVVNLALHVGAMEPWRFQFRAGGLTGTLVPFPSTTKLQLTWGTTPTTLVLTVGSGLTLEDAESVVEARLVARLTNAQSRTLPAGSLTRYELQTGAAEAERALFMGKVTVIGGLNPDA